MFELPDLLLALVLKPPVELPAGLFPAEPGDEQRGCPSDASAAERDRDGLPTREFDPPTIAPSPARTPLAAQARLCAPPRQ